MTVMTFDEMAEVTAKAALELERLQIVERRYEGMRNHYADALVIFVSETGAPIPTRECDWAAHVDGEEERGSALGRTKWDALRALIDQLEAEDE